MAIDLVHRANDGWIGAVFLHPGVEAHDRHRRCALLVVGIREQPPAPRGYAQGAEEIAGHILSVRRIGRRFRSRTAYSQRGVAGLERGEILEAWRVGAKEPVGFPGKQTPVVRLVIAALSVSAPVAAAGLIPDPPQILRLRHRQGLQHHLLHQREDRCRRPNPQRQGQHRRHRKSRRFPQLPQSHSQVSKHAPLPQP